MLESWFYILFIDWIQPHWPYLLTILSTLVSLFAAGHAILKKRDVRSALGWAGLIMLSPGIGVILYLCLGINRVQRKALSLRLHRSRTPSGFQKFAIDPKIIAERYGHAGETLKQIGRTVGIISGKPLLSGNQIAILNCGEEAYPEMLEAIHAAQNSITLQSYIFDSDALGQKFIEALAQAHARGVRIRVLIDAIGVRYSFPPASRLLRQRGIPVALFIPFRYIRVLNLRTHRKIMVVDGHTAFTGGMNIRQDHIVSEESQSPTADVHFKLEGPVVHQLQEVFAEDWNFTTGELLQGPLWFAPPELSGPICARGIADGPDETVSALAVTLHAAISAAQKRIRIVTPYFVPDNTLLSALSVAACRGIEVDLILPEKGNLKLVEWAAWSQLPDIISHGCRVWLSPAPFDHAKLMTIDGLWSLFGSSNWDQRSLRLNFEHNVEAYDAEFAGRLDALIEARLAQSRPLSLEQLESRPLHIRFRYSLARLMSPYL